MTNSTDWQKARHKENARFVGDIIQDFGSPEDEWQQLTSKSGLVDYGHRSRVIISGPDTVGFLDRLLTFRIKTLGVLRGCRPFLLDARGRIRSAFTCLRRDEETCWLDIAGGFGETLREQLDHFHFGERLSFDQDTEETRLVGVSGPNAAEVLARAGLPAPEVLYTYHATDDGVVVGRCPRAGSNHWDVWLPTTQQEYWWTRLASNGAKPVGILATEAVRIQSGQPVFPNEFNDAVTPLDSGGMDGITDGKGCYPGQEVIERTIALGRPARQLIQITASRDLLVGSDIYSDGVKVGVLTSVTGLGTHQASALGIIKGRTSAEALLSTDNDVTLSRVVSEEV